MHEPNKYAAKPAFGKSPMTDQYFRDVNSIIGTLRATASQRTIADCLNRHEFRTPRGLPWNRQRVAQYLRSRKV